MCSSQVNTRAARITTTIGATRARTVSFASRSMDGGRVLLVCRKTDHGADRLEPEPSTV
jgi:hypothetical protein